MSSRKLQTFTNLHGHSTYSAKDALGYPKEIVEAIKSNGMNSTALTEHGNFNSLSDFYIASKDAQFKPIYGQEFYVIPSHQEWRELAKKHKEEKDKGDEDSEKKGSYEFVH